MGNDDKDLVWLSDGIESPPFSESAKREAGYFLRLLQKGEFIEEPISKPLPKICKDCHELRINDKNITWRILYHIAEDDIVLLEIFKKKTRKTPQSVIETATQRLKRYYNTIED